MTRILRAPAGQWAADHFSGIHFGDARLSKES